MKGKHVVIVEVRFCANSCETFFLEILYKCVISFIISMKYSEFEVIIRVEMFVQHLL